MSADWSYEDGDKGWLFDVSVDGQVVLPSPSRKECSNDEASPGDGGYLKNETFTVMGFKLMIGKYVHEIPVESGSAFQMALNREVQRAYENDTDLQEEVFHLLEGS